jgi:hypothetical protein
MEEKSRLVVCDGSPPDFFADVVIDREMTVKDMVSTDPEPGQTELAPGWTIPGAVADYRKYLQP